MPKPKPTSAEEKGRAQLAYCLTQWKRPEGGDIPQSEAGIAEHQRLVEDYETIYGPANPNSLRQYANVYAGIRAGIAADAEADEALKSYKRSEAERKEREAAESRIRRQRQMDEAERAEAERVLSMHGQSMPLVQMQIDRLKGYTERDVARVMELRGMLERYRDSPLLGGIEKNLAHVEDRLGEYQTRLAKFEDMLEDAKTECEWAHGVLGTGPQPPPAGEPPPDPSDTPQQPPAPGWVNKHPYYEAVDPKPFDKVVVVDKPGDQRIKVFDTRPDPWANVVWFDGVRVSLKRSGLFESALTPEQFSLLNVRG